MGWVIFPFIAGAAVFLMMRLAGRRMRVRNRGAKSMRMCPDPKCRLPAGKCQHLRSQAEHAGSMLGTKPPVRRKKPQYGSFPQGKK